MSEYGKNKNVQKMEEKMKRIIKLLVTTVLLSALFAITVFAEESKALEIQKADEKVMYDSSTFYEKYTTVDGWWGDDFEVPYQCHVKMLVCGQNTGGKMTLYINNKGENMNKKKWLIIGILLVLGCIIAIYAYPILRTKILEPKVMELVSKNNSYTNFSYIQKATEENEQDLYIKRNGNYYISYGRKHDEEADIVYWGDYSTGEIIAINKKEKIAVIGNKDTLTGLSDHLEVFVKYFTDENYKIEHIKEDIINGQESYQVKLRNIEKREEQLKIWIDKETGVVKKIEHTYVEYGQTKTYSDNGVYNIEINKVTNKEVEKPDFSDYQIINAKERE